MLLLASTCNSVGNFGCLVLFDASGGYTTCGGSSRTAARADLKPAKLVTSALELEHGESPDSKAQFHYVPAVFNLLRHPSCLPASSQATRRHNIRLSSGRELVFGYVKKQVFVSVAKVLCRFATPSSWIPPDVAQHHFSAANDQHHFCAYANHNTASSASQVSGWRMRTSMYCWTARKTACRRRHRNMGHGLQCITRTRIELV